MTSSFEFHHTLLETKAADLVQNSPLDCLRPLEYHVEDASPELTSNVLEDLPNFTLGSK